MDMRYWIPAGAVSPDEEKETDFLTDETQRTQSQADMRYWIPAKVAFHSQEHEMRTDLVVEVQIWLAKKKMRTPKKHKQLFITVITIFETSPNTVR